MTRPAAPQIAIVIASLLAATLLQPLASLDAFRAEVARAVAPPG